MELKKDSWNIADGKVFQKYFVSLGRPEKEEWTKRIINTPMRCLAIISPQVKQVTKEIYSGNYLQFLDLWLWDYFENTSVNGGLICKIKDFDLMVKYLDIYVEKIDNWASSDLLSFAIKKDNEQKYFELAKKYIKSKKPFVRRTGINILFKFVDNKEYLPKIFELLNGFEDETEYYVNMVNSWLVAECFTKQREETLKFLETNKLNKFTINKAVQKCRDSFRITKQDKDMLLKFKR